MRKPTTATVTVDSLALDAHNANSGTPRGREALKRSLSDLGAGRSILLDKHHQVIAGNKTVQTALEAGIDEVILVPTDGTKLVAVVREDLDLATDSAARELAFADNRVGELDLAWNLGEIKDAMDAGLALAGFWSEDELQAIVDTLAPPPPADTSEPPMPESVPTRAQPGEIWQLGRHRLLCGDCTDAANVEALMDGQRAALCLTDPPYGVEWDYDSIDDTEEALMALVNGFLPLARAVADVVLVTTGNKNLWLYPRPTWTLCWFVAAGTGRSPWGFTCWQPIVAYGADPYLHAGLGSRPDALALTESSPDVDHPCPKPMKVWQWIMERGSVAADQIIYDPFVGSGTTIIAAERLHRICYAMELSPHYCDVVLARYEQETGVAPVRLREGHHA